jgi:hypothetical protein
MTTTSSDVYTSIPLPASDWPPAPVLLGVAAWLAGAVVVVAQGAWSGAPAVALPLTLISATVLAWIGVHATVAGRAWAARVSLRWLSLIHVWRVVPGVAFLVLHAGGQLPTAFAVPGGVGDVAVGLTAPLAAWIASQRRPGSRAALGIWQFVGIVDLLVVVSAAFRLTTADPSSMQLLRELPLGLLPTWAVPLTFVVHALAVRRLSRRSRPDAPVAI